MSTVRNVKKTITIVESEIQLTYPRKAFIFRVQDDPKRVSLLGFEVHEGLSVHPSSCVLRMSFARTVEIAKKWCDRIEPFDNNQSLAFCLSEALNEKKRNR